MNKKFTLIELIVSIVVIAILATIVIVQVQNFKERSIATYLQANTKELQTAVDLYYLENESYPTVNKNSITLSKPQYIDIAHLAKEGYFKKEIDLNKISTQHYKVDVFGKVWGSSIQSPKDMLLLSANSGTTNTFNLQVDEDAQIVTIYEVINGHKVTAAEYDLNSQFASKNVVKNDKISFKKSGELSVKGKTTVLIEIAEANKNYLVSFTDKYGMETAPVGNSYSPEEFTPVRGGEGEYEYILEGFSMKKWIEFITIQDTPNGSSISYEFALKTDRKGDYGKWLTEFPYEEKSYGIKVKIKMARGNDNAKPSLYGLRILYEEDEKKNPTSEFMESIHVGYEGGLTENSIGTIHKGGNEDYTPNPICPEGDVKTGRVGNQIIYGYSSKLNDDKILQNISVSMNGIEKIEVKYLENGAFHSVNSYLDIPKGSCFYTYIYVDATEYSVQGGGIYETAPPIYTELDYKQKPTDVVTIQPNGDVVPTEQFNESQDYRGSGGYPKENNPNDTMLLDNNWEIIDDFRFFQQGTTEATTWYGYTKDDEVIKDKTRILYRFAVGDGYYWSNELTEFPKDATSRALMVHVYFQVHKDHVNDTTIPDPKLKWIKIQSSMGEMDMSLFKPQMVIYPEKNNNLNRSTISDSSVVSWKYEAVDPNEVDIVNVEWSINNAEQVTYPVGSHSVRGRVQNNDGIWSDWMTYSFTVKQEKPIADFSLKSKTSYILVDQPAEFVTTGSQDPDGDEIVEYEWKNKKSTYSNEDVGKQTVSLRVQDSEGHWSDWVSKEFTILSESDIWTVDGEPATSTIHISSFDNDLSTYSNVSGKMISWLKSIEGKTLKLKLNTYYGGSYLNSTVSFINAQGVKINTLSNLEGYNLDHIINGADVEMRIIVPKGATQMQINGWGANLYELQVVEGSKPQNVSDITFDTTPYAVTINYTQSNSSNKTYLVGDYELKGISSNNQLKASPLSPNTIYKWDIFTVDSEFRISSPTPVQFKTSESFVTFTGLDIAAFDNDDSTEVTTPSRTARVTWDKDISGKTMYIQIRTLLNGNYYDAKVNFVDKNGNKLPALSSRETYQTDTILSGGTANLKFIVPQGATGLFVEDWLEAVQSIHLVSPEKTVAKVTNVSTVIEQYKINVNWTQSNEANKTFVIVGDKVRATSLSSSATATGLTPETNYVLQVISVDNDFIASEPIRIPVRTGDVAVIFSGIGNEALDDDYSTYLKPDSFTLNWDRTITGKKIAINYSASDNYGNFYNGSAYFLDSDGKRLTSINADTGESLETHVIDGRATKHFVVPAGAVAMKFENWHLYVYDIRLIE